MPLKWMNGWEKKHGKACDGSKLYTGRRTQKELERVEEEQGRPLRIFFDYRDKPEKFERISTLATLFKRGFIRFNSQEKESPGMKLLRKQLLGFGDGSKINDDGPDALEGGIWYIDKYGKRLRNKARSGKYKKNDKRRM